MEVSVSLYNPLLVQALIMVCSSGSLLLGGGQK